MTKIYGDDARGIVDGWRKNAFVGRNEKHVPSNKHSYEIHKSICTLTIKDYNGRKPGAHAEPWTEVHLEETTQAKEGGPFQTRQIAFTLCPEGRRLLRAYLDECEAKEWQ